MYKRSFFNVMAGIFGILSLVGLVLGVIKMAGGFAGVGTAISFVATPSILGVVIAAIGCFGGKRVVIGLGAVVAILPLILQLTYLPEFALPGGKAGWSEGLVSTGNWLVALGTALCMLLVALACFVPAGKKIPGGMCLVGGVILLIISLISLPFLGGFLQDALLAWGICRAATVFMVLMIGVWMKLSYRPKEPKQAKGEESADVPTEPAEGEVAETA